MKTFPMFLMMRGRRVVILGGGEQAAQKCRLILKTEAAITVAAPTLEAELSDLAARGRIAHHPGAVTAELLEGTALVFCATGCAGADAALHALAKAAGATVNVVDRPDLCDAYTPSIVDRDPVVVAIGTEGTAPVLGRQIKTQVETLLEPRLGDLAALAGRLRDAAARLAPRTRRDLWRWAFAGPVRALHARGAERAAATTLKDAIAEGAWADDPQPLVSLVGAGPGASDLITLRGVRRLQEADVIFYDALADPALLELARRDAERVFVGKRGGRPSWPQGRINGLIVAAARQGRRVVRLKCGDPGIFARAAEEVDALRAAGLACEIVPGVTAASAAAAATGRTLTERGATDALTLATATCADGSVPRGWLDRLRPGTTLAVYMGMRHLPEIERALTAAGLAAQVEAEIVQNAAAPDMRRLAHPVAGLARAARDAGIGSPAVILLRRPLRAAPALAIA
ncbi:MAG: siroheme synthase CysG [Hasllibacter sp.]